MASGPTSRPVVQRQAKLPLSKAVEIAYKSIRLRLTRSLLVTSGIVLALAFLMSIRGSDALVQGMRTWINEAPRTPHFVTLQAEHDKLRGQIEALDGTLRRAVAAAPRPARDAKAFDPKVTFGATFPELQKELGSLPAPAATLIRALTADAALVEQVRQWIDLMRRDRVVANELNGPKNLEAKLKATGVPTAEEEIRNSDIQTRWLLGLALLVAFVGILNAMLMSVTERFREIGTMKCLGALDSFIVKLFLIESLFQGIVGTTLGILLGLALSLLGGWSTYGHFVWQMVPWGEIMMSVAMCLLVGVGLTVAGAVYPAWQAARMQPIEAMRVET